MDGQQVTSIPELTARVEAIFRGAGFSADHADALSRVLVAGERDGCKSHGIYRVEGCLRTLKRGKVVADAVPVVSADDSAIVRVNAAGGFSNAAFEAGLPKLVERTRTLGVAAMVINDCTHFAALWPEIEAITEHGLAALAMCPSYATVAPVGGREPLLGTNPLAFGWPRRGHPFVFDFATSVAARGEIELRRRAGETLPAGWALGPDGSPTENPEEALAGAMLPFGGHKGSAISTMIELLAGAMIGDLTSREALDWLGDTSLSPSHGELILAFDPARFAAGREGSPEARAEMLFDAIVGQGARLPSQRRFAARETAETDGIVLTAEEDAQLERLEREGLAAVS
ncbi:Ldh family oxidoreductase [Arhodomonas aquaeolei]|uniref:Ldh family oxidoreductase n=1 Tax=Arhodomonas aquaeolei TaxID=2369 RepID=UPI0021670F6C|nr:Ldh family oxidoreductase [Arhodomonas aquaeolei]MCS4503365.1 Ldh family oxidoreductase [Arhodomonas aquaeolei]